MAQQIHISAENTLDAAPSVVYSVIADYRTGHPLITPKPYFQGIQVESGGVGAGTLITVTMRVFGVTSQLHHKISEPEPGRVLVESDLDDEASQTIFTVVPANGGKQAHVDISTTMRGHPGIRGQIERWLIPFIMRPVYQKELRLLEAVAQQWMVATPGADTKA